MVKGEIQTSTQKELANLSSETALKQAEASREVAKMNNDAQTQRLQINLAYAQQQRNEDRADQAAQLEIQRQAQAQQIALAERQADQALELSRQNREAQSLQTALAGGTGASSVPQASAIVNPLANSLAGAGASSSPAAAASSTGVTSNATSTTRALLSGDLPMARGLVGKTEAVALSGAMKEDQFGSSRLLASVDTSITNLENVEGLQTILKRTSKSKGFGMPRVGLKGKRGFLAKPLRNGRGLYANGSDPRVGGSYPESLKNKAALLEFAARAETRPVLLGERLNSGSKGKVPTASSH